MYIEIRKAGFVNKGAALMLHAVLQEMSRGYGDAKLVMTPGFSDSPYPYRSRASLGLYQKAWLWRYGLQLGDLAALAPARLRDMYGVVLDREIDVVLDAAGFAYSDQWGVEPCRELHRASRRWKKRGTKVILLPQAFGPFTTEAIKKEVRGFIGQVDLVYARDQVSYDHLIEVVGKQGKIRIAPDFTNLLQGVRPEHFKPQGRDVCLIPNCRMLDKTSETVQAGYLPFLEKAARLVVKKGGRPFILVHEGADDLRLAQRLSESMGGLEIIKENDPLRIKGILGACSATIGSRFHGLVSALSQGVPSLATGWSHKYEMLFQDYGFPEGVVNIDIDDQGLELLVSRIMDVESCQQLSNDLLHRSQKWKQDSRRMWREVFEFIEQ